MNRKELQLKEFRINFWQKNRRLPGEVDFANYNDGFNNLFART